MDAHTALQGDTPQGVADGSGVRWKPGFDKDAHGESQGTLFQRKQIRSSYPFELVFGFPHVKRPAFTAEERTDPTSAKDL